MGKLLRASFGWVIGKAGILVVVIVALLFAPRVQQLITVIGEFDLGQIEKEILQAVTVLTPNKTAPKEEMAKKLDALRLKQKALEKERNEIRLDVCILPTCKLARSAMLYKIDLELEFINQAIAYAEAILSGSKSCNNAKLFQDLLTFLNPQLAILQANRPPWYLWPSPAEKRLQEQIEDTQTTLYQHRTACDTYRRIQGVFSPKKPKDHDAKHKEFLEPFEELQKASSALFAAIGEVLPTAFVMLLGIIVAPLLFRLISYYGFGSLASRGRGITLCPHASGITSIVSGSKRLQDIELDPGWELVVAPDLVQSSPPTAKKQTILVFDWSMPMSCLVSGLYGMTGISSSEKETIGISAGPIDSARIAILDVPEGSSLVLQPRCLVGVLRPSDRQLRISLHWRLGHLVSWLSMQLRYVVFHGPAKLVVRGNGGIQLTPVENEKSLVQQATLGFTANLAYSVSRCDTFYAYITEKKNLFDDHFSGKHGYFVQEVTPGSIPVGLLRRLWEIIVNLILRILGL